ncbi:MAG: Xaa-Pro peptidase family protein [Candidatus Omnitrophica bacterium]|nr:Xaa-Pro peptidase family protein [Candidatus Omnitrophota bacterium]MDD4012668.1 Xaa-Pro peptidase family protein [Candidatus Omnitrophota bacterium]
MKKYRDTLLGRIGNVQRVVGRQGLEAALITRASDIQYLTGLYFEGSVFIAGRSITPRFMVDSMNYSLAHSRLSGEGICVVNTRGDRVEALRDALPPRSMKKIGYQASNVSHLLYLTLARALRGSELIDSSPCDTARMIKLPSELRHIRHAARETLRIWRDVSRKIAPGMTEKEIAALVDLGVRKRGYVNSFETIAASGPNGAFPHAIPTDRRLKKGECLLVDFGIRSGGYCSDLTRVWSKGRIMRKIRLLLDHVLTIQSTVISMIRPGVQIRKLLDEVEKYIKNNSLDKHVLHGLGHGLGLDVHEPPFLSSREKSTVLKSGMVITVEPGLYEEGLGGVRVEDMVLVKAGGCEVLTR